MKSKHRKASQHKRRFQADPMAFYRVMNMCCPHQQTPATCTQKTILRELRCCRWWPCDGCFDDYWRLDVGGVVVVRVLIACEYSGRVRNAFAALGHDAMSCDLLPSETPGNHYQGDVFDLDLASFDLMICHPPCTHLAVSGARHFAAKQASGVQQEALEFVRRLLDAPVPKICLENPVSIISTRIRKPSQVIQPWMFGHGETKATCLWLKGLPKLYPTNLVDGRKPVVHHMPPGAERWKNRSRTYMGVAQAMAAQWSNL